LARTKPGFWFWFAVVVLKPLLLLVTGRDWRHRERVPRQGGVVVATNHNSHLDPLVVAHFLWDLQRPVRFLAKASVFDVPFVGMVVRGAKQIPVYRETVDAGASVRAAVAAVERGECVVVYPEGTLTRDPGLWPMVGKSGAARIALTSGCPVIPLAHWGANEVLPPYAKRPHLFPRKTVRVTVGEPVDLDDLRGRPIDAVLLKEATDRIMAAITELLAQLRQEEPPAQRFDPRAAGLPVIGNPKRARGSSGSRPSREVR
jgi:1-acyl-sn-glycerol-3-phosphate acyltransferase